MRPLLPPVRSSALPPFHEIDPEDFERLTADILQEEDGVAVSDLHGRRGQSDHGVDVLATGRDGWIDVASCKRYERVSPAQLADWSHEALKHWPERWSKRGVRRFILATSAVNVADTKIHDQVALEAARFAALGVRYELWGPRHLTSRMSRHRQLASRYLTSAWADLICGPANAPEAVVSGSGGVLGDAVPADLRDLRSLVSDFARSRVDAALDELRAGRSSTAAAVVHELRSTAWESLAPEARTACIRLEASLALNEGDLARARLLASEEQAIDPEAERRIEARIAAEEDRPEEALCVLGSPTSVSGRQLQVSLLLAVGDRSRAAELIQTLLEEDAADPETLRLLTLERILSGCRSEALTIARSAELRAGHWIATKRAAVVARYAMALSPALGPEWAVSPNPFDGSLARQDDEARGFYLEALSLLDEIEAVGSLSRTDAVFRLAVLLNVDGRRSEAVKAAIALLQDEPGDPMVVAWCVMRDLPVDLAASEEALRRAYEGGTRVAEIRALALLGLRGGEVATASHLRDHLQSQIGEAREEAATWIGRLTGAPGDPRDRAILRAQRDGDWDVAAQLLREMLSGAPPDPMGLSLAEFAASASQWGILLPLVDGLLAYGTATATRLAVLATVNNGDYVRTLSILEEYGRAFGASLPGDMARVRADCLSRTGAASSALREAATLASSAPDAGGKLFLAGMRARFGNVRPALPDVHRALESGALAPEEALRWSALTGHHDPQLSRRLFLSAVEAGIRDDLVSAALDQAFRLGLDEEVGGLIAAMQRRAARGEADVRAFTLDEVRAFLAEQQQSAAELERRYLDGQIPVHLYAAGRPEVLLSLLSGHAGSALRPMPIRHGGRPVDWQVGIPWRKWRIHLDVTGLLTSHRIGLLPALEAHPNGITVAPRLPELLLEMQSRAAVGQPSRIAVMRRILDGIAQGRLREAHETGAPRNMVRLEVDPGEAGIALPALAATLRAVDFVSVQEADVLVAGLEGVPDGAQLELPPELVLDDLVAERFEAAGFLDRLVRLHAVAIPAPIVLGMRREVERHEEGLRLSRIAGELAERVGLGIETGVYGVLPVHDHAREPGGALQAVLADLLSNPAGTGSVVWFDDRFLTGYVHAGPHPIVGTLDALTAMLADGALTAESFDSHVAELQRAGAFFVPISTSAVLRELRMAPVCEGRLQETSGLAMLRRAHASGRGLEGHLKIGPSADGSEERPDEDAAARQSLRLFGDVLEAVWTSFDIEPERAAAMSDWLLESLLLLRLNRDSPHLDVPQARETLKVLQVAHLLEKATEVGGHGDSQAARRDAYLRWCWSRLVLCHQLGTKAFVDRIGGYLSQLYGALVGETAGGRDRDATISEVVIRRRAERLPDPVRDLVTRSGVFRRTLRFTERATVGALRFPPHRFWRAARTAFRYGPTSVRSCDGRRVTFRRDGDHLALTGAIRTRLPGIIPAALAAGERDRGDHVSRILERLELPPTAAANLRARLMRANSAEEFARHAADAEKQSCRIAYDRLQSSLRSRRGAAPVDLRPHRVEPLLHFFGLSGQGLAQERIEAAARVLGERVGAAEAMARLSGLPVRAEALAVAAGRADGRALLIPALTPGSIIQAAAVAVAQKVPFEASEILTRMVRAADRWGRFHVALLRWTWACLALDPDRREIDEPTALALTWLHSGMVLDAFARADIRADGLHEALPDVEEVLPSSERLVLHTTGPTDAADPFGIESDTLLFHQASALFDILGSNAVADDAQTASLKERWTRRSPEGDLPQPSLWFRKSGPDALGGYLGAHPPEWMGLPSTEETRANLVQQALQQVRDAPADLRAWHLLGGAMLRGAGSAEQAEMLECFDRTDVIGLSLSEEGGPEKLRLLLAPLAWARPAGFPDLLREAARRASRLPSGSPAAIAWLEELVEAAHLAGLREPFVFDDLLFATNLSAIAEGWPQSTARLRRIVAGITVSLAPDRWPQVWRLQLDLQRRP